MSRPVEDLWRKQLREGVGDEPLSARQTEQLIGYLFLLRKWNRVFNLTAVRDDRDLVPRHLLDSAAIAGFVEGPRVADVGTGAGLPGIPLAVLRPQWSFSLVDASSKKTRFLRQVMLELGLGNLEVVHSRVEAYRPTRGFDTVVSRAFSSLSDFWMLAGHLAVPGGCLLAMKGRRPVEEFADLPPGVTGEIRRLPGGRGGERHLVVLRAGKLG